MTGAVVLLSGGLDSGVAAAAWVAGGGTLAACLTFDYGQRAAAPEAGAARRFADRLGAPWHPVALQWLGELAARAGSALVRADLELPEGSADRPGDQDSADRVWVPGRNAVFVAIGASWAEALGADHVVAGFNREEAATFPDNSADFVAAASRMLALGTRTGVTVASPTQEWDKARIVTEARRLGFAPADFWSCYREGPERCGRCESCRRSHRAWAEA